MSLHEEPKQLSRYEEQIIAILRTNLLQHATSFWIKNATEERLNRCFNRLRLTVPELYDFDTFEYRIYPETGKAKIILKYTDRRKFAAEIEKERKRYLSQISGRDDWEKVLCLHDLLCKNITYSEIGIDSHTIVGPLIYRKGVCEAIAETVKYICDALAIPCVIVTGVAGDPSEKDGMKAHSWNKVLLNKQWVNLDVTFDLTLGKPDAIRHDYFALSDATISCDHFPSWRSVECNMTGLDYYAKRGLVVKDLTEFKHFCKEKLRSGARFIEFRFPYSKPCATATTDQFLESMFNMIGKAMGDCGISASFSVFSHFLLNTFSVLIS